VFFFFQAEDGIRDGHVTGVQTCALPISAAESWAMERDGATIVLKVRQGLKFPSGRPVTAQAVKYCFDRGLQSPGYMRLLFPSLIGVKSSEQFEVRDEDTFALRMEQPNPMA